MAKKNKYDTAHLKNLSSYERQIAEIYKEAVREAALLGTAVPNVDADKVFSFADYPITTRRINTLLDTLRRNVTSVIINGISTEWALSNEKNDDMVNSALGQAVRTLTAEQRRQYFSNNDSALQAFAKRKVDGMTLSDRVWKYTDQFKSEIELGIDIGLREGRSAQQLSRDLRDYLQHPDKLFRRVRDEHGNLVLSRRAAAYHPGQGVYRSSYKNAIRMTGTETNMAYRTADHNRWQLLDFVVGQEIHTSNNHTLNGKDFKDMCDELAGKYPKDFVFTGWHPNCRCYATSILKSREEMREDSRRIINGEEPLPAKDSVNYVPTVPKGFEDWVVANKDRIARAKSVPYFIKDNQDLVDKILKEATQIFATAEEADNALRTQAGEVWLSATKQEKTDVYRYTKDTFIEINRNLRNDDFTKKGVNKKIENITNYINRSIMNRDLSVNRVVAEGALAGMFGINPREEWELINGTGNVSQLIGKEGIEKGFMSTSLCGDRGYSRGVTFHIFVPKGTCAAYVEPFSSAGKGAKIDWDGKSKQNDFSHEMELLIQRGQKVRITRAKRDNKILEIWMDLI